MAAGGMLGTTRNGKEMETKNELDTRIQSYLETRAEQYRNWYDAKAVKMKKYYMRARIVSAVGAVLVPILNNANLAFTVAGRLIDLASLSVTLIGLLVAVLIALEGVLRHRDQWRNYRSTEQYLETRRKSSYSSPALVTMRAWMLRRRSSCLLGASAAAPPHI
jgi:hypothetical protein